MKTFFSAMFAMLWVSSMTGAARAADAPASGEAPAPAATQPTPPPTTGAELWVPHIAWVIEKDGARTLLAVTNTPDSCYRPAGSKPGFPMRKTAPPDTLGVQLNFSKSKTGHCLKVVTPVFHTVRGLNVKGKTVAAAYAMVGRDLKGSNAADIPFGALPPTQGDVPVSMSTKQAP